ncbi:hypothetical protein K443DRAFT_16130 [Laccaria amethystina LaAM-08-1]|uniref:Unplaced genomic scaffold K443scaffold_1206, whole genome shotgun sequence n=1 Tax=Laccaria amethystina LaAM-08-1 TaxID=1095629 RepID=A0A0C9WKH4_9AGAR|nr:hypothetical protein K443DRAFT_16130 [Laccaria amethystina LaAM-08-1]
MGRHRTVASHPKKSYPRRVAIDLRRRHRAVSRESESGKCGRAIRKLDAKRMARLQGGRMGAYGLVRDQVGHEDRIPEPADYATQLHIPNVCDINMEYTVVDLYAVRPELHRAQGKEVKPFIHQIKLHRLNKEAVQIWGLFDNGAMVDAMSTKAYMRVRHKLAPLERSTRHLRMANGSIVSPAGCWKGTVELGGIMVAGSFEVFDSSGDWEFLFGKRLMTAFSAVHDYATDKVFLPASQQTLQNQCDVAHLEGQTQSEEEHETKEGDKARSPMRGVPTDHYPMDCHVVDTSMTVGIEQQENTESCKQPPIVEAPQMEKQTATAGDRTKSPSMEVPSAALTTNETTANDVTSHRASIEEVEDKDGPRHEARTAADEKTTVANDQLEQHRETASGDQEHQNEKVEKKATTTGRKWKGPSQRRHCRWKTRNEKVARAK